MWTNWLFNLICHVIFLDRVGARIESNPHPYGAVETPRSWRDQCKKGPCFPNVGDLVIGRENQLTATSTCGMEKPERYCILSNLNERSCYICDSRQPYQGRYNEQSHRIQNVVEKMRPRDERQKRWWQAENAVENVSIQLNLEAEFYFTHLLITFKTFRPAAMLIERSADYGKSWKVYRYFAYNCESSFPGIPQRPPQYVSEVVCLSEYSDITPSTDGQVLLKTLESTLPMSDLYSPEIQELQRITNIRINFTKLHTMGDELLDSRPQVTQKYYYAVKSINVRGSCSCYGHASRCVPEHRNQQILDNMVYGKCECTHNTKGRNCEECQDFYHDRPWMPAFSEEVLNECKRCECNRHASRCHFDESVYEASGNVSGGVCDDCMHNTMGVHCQSCVPFYYRPPDVPLDDASACRPCDCEPSGSQNDGVCDAETNEEKGLVAGRCRCKANVTGPRCDVCKDGYYQLEANNPDGCKMCTCKRLGTYMNRGCDKRSGHCTCKRNVQQDDKCDKCIENHYGLSEDPDGCKPCACHEGGSLGPECDEVSGQCKCKPGFRGRDCSVAEDGFYCPLPNHYTYDAEKAEFADKSQIVPREGTDRAWMGEGFVRVRNGDSIVFKIGNFSQPATFKLVIWYESQLRDHWEDVTIAVVRPGQPNPANCHNYSPNGDFGKTYFSPTSSSVGYAEVSNMDLCFEPNIEYEIRLVIGPQSSEPEPDASLLIDRITLLPEIILSDRSRQEYVRHGCDQYLLRLSHHPAPEVCQRLFCVKGAAMVAQAIDCECDKTGSISGVCEANGGQCQCRPNVFGRRCDSCVPGAYGFSPTGCTECNCDPQGSTAGSCDLVTGQCPCKTNIIGSRCDSCQPGYWAMPNCTPCQCNGHADTCDQRTGACIDCRELTTGHYCDTCKNGYYGDPRQGVDIPCKECLCPSGPVTGPNHADTCYAPHQNQPDSPEQNKVICNCNEGYIGERCDECDVNYWGNPKERLGSCVKCSCNENIDWTVPESCHPTTGRCQKCIYNTAGEQCEICASGYFGNALDRTCQSCECNPYGHNATAGPCDHVSGGCPCFANVTGKYCDQCLPNHFNLTSGEGCSHCDCDPDGVTEDENGEPRLGCDLQTGQCQCRRERGGRTCHECQNYYWGDPKDDCKQCECDQQGTFHYQCNRDTGACVCREPYGGYKCDECARGFMGVFPDCRPCDPCFKQWDAIIEALHNKTRALISHAQSLRDRGALSVYDTDFDAMRKQLSSARAELDTANVTKAKVDQLQMKIDELKDLIQKEKTSRSTGFNIDKRFPELHSEIQDAKDEAIDLMVSDADNLNELVDNLLLNVTAMRAMGVSGAYEICKDEVVKSGINARNASAMEASIHSIMDQASRTKLELDNNKDKFKETYNKSVADLQTLNKNVSTMTNAIPEMNHLVCGENTADCSVVCGGAGCGKCGRAEDASGVGSVCDWGSRSKAVDAVAIAEENNGFFKDKIKETNAVLDKIRAVVDKSERPISKTFTALEDSNETLSELSAAQQDADRLLNETAQLLADTENTFDELVALADTVKRTELGVDEAMMQSLLDELQQVNEKIQNVGTLTDELERNLSLATQLKDRADQTKKQTDELIERKEKLEGDLGETESTQEQQNAELADIDGIVDDIKKNNEELKVVLKDVDQMVQTGVTNTSILDEVKALRQEFVTQSGTWQSINTTVKGIKEAQKDMDEELKKANSEYEKAKAVFDTKNDQAEKDLVRQLQEKASTLVDTTSKNLDLLNVVKTGLSQTESRQKMQKSTQEKLRDKLSKVTMEIRQKQRFHSTCAARGSVSG